MLTKVISGGQTGVDRAALDAALECGLAIGGYCPLGRLAEDGRIPGTYPLVELPTPNYPARTRRNVQVADATLVLIDAADDMAGGTLLTQRVCLEECQRSGKAFCIAAMSHEHGMGNAVGSLTRHFDGTTLNVAGPRESKCPGIYARAKAFLLEVFKAIQEPKVG